MKEASPSSVGVKALIAMSNSRPSSREGAIDDKKWLAQAEAIRSFLESTPESAESISSHARDTVLQQLQRGDAHVEARGKCWQHVAIELSNLPEWQQLCDAAIQCEPPPTPTPMEVHGASPRQSGLISPPPPGAGEAADVPALNLEYFGSAEPPPRSKSAQELRTTPKPAVDSPPHSLSARNQADEDRATNKTPSEAPPSPTREAAPPAQPTTSAAATKPKAKMTMMERQNAWMQAKAAALEAAKAEKEKELNDSLKFKPDIESSKRTYKTTPAASTRPEQPRPVLSNPKPMPAAPAPPPAAASKWTLAKAKVAKVKKAKNTKNAKADNKPGASAPVGAEKLAELLAQDKTATVKTTSNPAVEEVEGEEGPEKAREEEEAPLEEEEEEEVAPEEPFVPGSFWWRVEDGRGHYRVNDGSLFQMWTIYRRKDKSRDVDGEGQGSFINRFTLA